MIFFFFLLECSATILFYSLIVLSAKTWRWGYNTHSSLNIQNHLMLIQLVCSICHKNTTLTDPISLKPPTFWIALFHLKGETEVLLAAAAAGLIEPVACCQLLAVVVCAVEKKFWVKSKQAGKEGRARERLPTPTPEKECPKIDGKEKWLLGGPHR